MGGQKVEAMPEELVEKIATSSGFFMPDRNRRDESPCWSKYFSNRVLLGTVFVISKTPSNWE
jgi:hypothetical protein